MKDKPIKIRREWNINPRERIREDKPALDICEKCGKYKTNPKACLECEYGEIGDTYA